MRRSILSPFLQRRERWSLTTFGWLAVLLVGTLSAWLFLLEVYPFLALTDRTDSQFLVVEGWIPNYAFKESIAELKTRRYRLLLVVGCDILNGVNVEPGDNHADYAVKRLAPSPVRFETHKGGDSPLWRDSRVDLTGKMCWNRLLKGTTQNNKDYPLE